MAAETGDVSRPALPAGSEGARERGSEGGGIPAEPALSNLGARGGSTPAIAPSLPRSLARGVCPVTPAPRSPLPNPARDALIRNEVKVSKVLTQTHRRVEFTVGKRLLDGITLAEYIRALCPRYELEFVNRWCAQGHCTIDGQPCRGDQGLSTGQAVLLLVPLPPTAPDYVVPPLEFLWRDQHLAIANKPPGHLAHQAGQIMNGTLMNQLQDWALAHGGDPGQVRLVNRIDRDTSGIVLVSWHLAAHVALSRALEGRALRKEYLAICHGCPEPMDGSWLDPLGPGDPASIAHIVRSDGKPSHTEYHVIATVGRFSLLRLVLHTGRQHQIRVHASHHGCPLVGDWVYGEPCAELPGQALHAAVLAGAHPVTQEAMRWEAPLPQLFADLWTRIQAGGSPTRTELNPAQRSKLGLT